MGSQTAPGFTMSPQALGSCSSPCSKCTRFTTSPTAQCYLRNFRLRDQLLSESFTTKRKSLRNQTAYGNTCPTGILSWLVTLGERPQDLSENVPSFWRPGQSCFYSRNCRKAIRSRPFSQTSGITPAGNCKKFSTAKELANLSSEIFVQ